MNTFKKITVTVVSWCAITSIALAQYSNGKLDNPIPGTTNLNAFFSSITTIAIELGTIVAGLAIMYGGFLYVTAQGDEEKLHKAQNTITWALVGTAILLGARVIFLAIQGTVQSLGQ